VGDGGKQRKGSGDTGSWRLGWVLEEGIPLLQERGVFSLYKIVLFLEYPQHNSQRSISIFMYPVTRLCRGSD